MNFKHNLFAAAMVSLLCVGSAVASDSATLRVIGTIKPAACNVLLSNENIDLGNILLSGLSDTFATDQPPKPATLQVQCDSVTAVAVKVSDNTPDTLLQGAGHFGLGKGANGKPIGAYAMTMASTMTQDLLSTSDNGLSWIKVADAKFKPNTLHKLSTSKSNLKPSGQKDHKFDFEIHAMINKKGELDAVNNTVLDGSVTFTLVYM